MKILLFELILVSICYSQIPKECGQNFTLKTGVCCPLLDDDDEEPCGFPRRGECLPVEIFENATEWYNYNDSRMLWPKFWFKTLCKCKTNFYGAGCDQCIYGYQGENCLEKHIKIRRNIFSYTREEKEILMKVLVAMREEESRYLIVEEAYENKPETIRTGNIHEMIVNIHFLARRYLIRHNKKECENVPSYNLNHNNIGFLTWHRHFMLLWEKWASEIAKRKFNLKRFSFPYWDWVDKTSCEICTDDLIGSKGEVSDDESYYLNGNNRFNEWKIYCDLFDSKDGKFGNKCSPCSTSRHSQKLKRKFITNKFPTMKEIEFALSRKRFASNSFSKENCHDFAVVLEGFCSPSEWEQDRILHNFVHSNVLGTFADSSTSPNDPLFVFHHIQVDRIFQAWWKNSSDQAKIYPNISHPGHCFKCNQVGFIPSVPHEIFFVDSSNLGYEYDSLEFGKKL